MMTLDYTFERRLQLAEEERRKVEGQLTDTKEQLTDKEEQLKGALHQIDRMRKLLAEHGIESA